MCKGKLGRGEEEGRAQDAGHAGGVQGEFQNKYKGEGRPVESVERG